MSDSDTDLVFTRMDMGWILYCRIQ